MVFTNLIVKNNNQFLNIFQSVYGNPFECLINQGDSRVVVVVPYIFHDMKTRLVTHSQGQMQRFLCHLQNSLGYVTLQICDNAA